MAHVFRHSPDVLPDSIGRLQSLGDPTFTVTATVHDSSVFHPLFHQHARCLGLCSFRTQKSRLLGSLHGSSSRAPPPLVHSLELLYLGESRLVDGVLPVLRTILREICVFDLALRKPRDDQILGAVS